MDPQGFFARKVGRAKRLESGRAVPKSRIAFCAGSFLWAGRCMSGPSSPETMSSTDGSCRGFKP